jgi:hypothetical protein
VDHGTVKLAFVTAPNGVVTFTVITADAQPVDNGYPTVTAPMEFCTFEPTALVVPFIEQPIVEESN